MLKKNNRISSQSLIIRLAKKGKVTQTKSFIFKHFPSHSSESKFALSVSKKNLAKAVKRNRIKRQVYHSLKEHLDTLKIPTACLIIHKKGNPEQIKYKQINAEVKQFINSIK